MSSYIIYRIDHHDPLLVGKRRRRLNVFFGIAAFFFLVAYLSLQQLFNLGFTTSYIPFVIVITCFYYYFYRRLKKENKQIKAIGEIEFSRNGIIKRIGGISEEYPYSSVKALELKRHIPAINATESKSGFSTYILTIDLHNNHSEKMVVSDRPAGRWRDLSITQTVRTLKKITPVEISLT